MTTLADIAHAPRRDPCPEARYSAIGHVLVGLDRSTRSESCLTQAQFVSEAFGAKLTLLHVIPSPQGSHEPNRADALEWEIAKREADQYLSRAKASVGAAPRGTLTRLTQGVPAEQIIRAARETGADLIVVSRYGEGGGQSSPLGGTARQVLASAVGSVLLAHATGEHRLPPRRMLVPLDGSLRSECVLPYVGELARFHGTEVVLVHVVTDPTPTAVMSAPGDIELASSLASRVQVNAEEYLARTRGRLLPRGIAARTLVVRRPEERQALLDVATQEAADMLVITAHGATCNVERAAGSVASYLLSHAQIPVFVLQDMPRDPLEPVPGRTPRGALSARSSEDD